MTQPVDPQLPPATEPAPANIATLEDLAKAADDAAVAHRAAQAKEAASKAKVDELSTECAGALAEHTADQSAVAAAADAFHKAVEALVQAALSVDPTPVQPPPPVPAGG